jgi:hypothetical protein
MNTDKNAVGILKKGKQVAGATAQKYGIGAGWVAWAGLDVYLGYEGASGPTLILSPTPLLLSIFLYQNHPAGSFDWLF